ncbi:MAG: TetR/AcrR family transcriptional regulator [Firmicutes bacterium]|nr:TetR/AcrR family transcriptional regulator [Bacillota bacterium]
MNKMDFRLPKTKVGEKTFYKIIKAGKKLFSKNGFHVTSINDIIAKSKVAAGTFYIYFDSKLALYLYLLEEYRYSIQDEANKAIEGLTTRFDIEREGLKSFIMFVKRDPLAYKLIWESLFVDSTIFKEYYQSFSLSYVNHLRKYVEIGELRKDINLETMSYVLMGISNFIGFQIIFKEQASETDIDFVVDETMKLLKNGIFQ